MNNNQNQTEPAQAPEVSNLAAPSVTIAPRSPAKGVVIFVVTLTDHQQTREYPCRSLETAVGLASRYLKGVIKSVTPAAEPVAA